MRLGDLDELKKVLDEQMNFDENCRDSVFDIIDNAPTVEGEILTEEAYSDLCLRASRERPQGEWIEGTQGYYCSKCETIDKFYFEHNFCPICGADMRGEKE